MGIALNSLPWAHPSRVGAFTYGPAVSDRDSAAHDLQEPCHRATTPLPILHAKPRSTSLRAEHAISTTSTDRPGAAYPYYGSLVADDGIEPVSDADGLLFDFDEPRSRRRDGSELDDAAVLAELEMRELVLFGQQVEMLILPSSSFQLQLQRDVKRVKQFAHRSSGGVDVLPLTLELARLGYNVVFRESMGGSQNGLNYLTNLRHEFAYVASSDSFSESAGQSLGEQLLIEFNLRQQFAIAAPTARFEQVLQLVPDVFVGTKEQLVELIALLSIEIEQAFMARNLSLPPWRQARSLLSKWFPRLARDEVPAAVAGQRGGTSAPCQTSDTPWLQSPQLRMKSKARTIERSPSCPLESPTS